MLRQILRFASRQSSKTVVARFFSNKSTKIATKSIRKNSKNGQIFSSNLNVYPISTKFTGPLGTSAFKKYSTVNKNNGESIEDLKAKLNKSVQERNAAKALEYATKLMEMRGSDKTPEQLLSGLHMKLLLQIDSNKPHWDVDDFLAALQKLGGTEYVGFSEIWDSLTNVLHKFKSYDSRYATFFDKAFKAFPNNFLVILQKAEVLLNCGLKHEATDLLERAIEIDPHKSRPWMLLWSLHPTKELYLKKALECPDASEKHSFLWCEYAKKQILQDGDFEAGMESLKKAVNKRILPVVEDILFHIANELYSVKFDSTSAERVVRLWLEVSPNNGTAWSTLGTISSTQKNHQEAERCYRKAIELAPDNPAAWFNLGNMVAPKEGIPLLLQAVKLNPDLHEAHCRLAVYYCNLQQFEKGLESVNKAIQLQKHPYYLTLKASICAVLKQYKEEFLTAREIVSANAQDPLYACIIFEMEERYEEGLVYIREKLEHDPKNHSFLITEATFLNNLTRYDEALKVVDQAIQIAREKDDQYEYQFAMVYKAIILARSDNIIEAKQLAEFLRQQDPIVGTHPLGIVYMKEGNFDKALEMFEFNANFTRFEMLRYTYFMDIAAVYEAKGDLLAAEKYYNLVLEINPDAKSVAEKLKEIKKPKNR